MKDFVRNHAITNVWAATNQDFQHNIKLVRITPSGGILTSFKLLWDTLLTPKENDKYYYHFYQIGQVPPEVLDVIKHENRWICLKEFNKENNILVDVYSATGQIVPRDHVHLSFIYNKNLVVAIRYNHNLDYGKNVKIHLNQSVEETPYTLDNQQLIIRFYSNAWFNDIEYRENRENKYAVNNSIRFEYKTINTAADWKALWKTYTDLLKENRAFANRTVWYIDGFHVNTPLGMKDEYIGKHIGWMFDDSFFHIEYFPIRHLHSFISERDRGRRKYLIFTSITDNLIHYWDDVDFYVVNTRTGKGVYYNRSSKWGVRQITHNAYSLDADVVEDYINTHDFLGDIDSCSIKIMVRQGGRRNGVFNQKNRLKELYMLPKQDIISALINVPSLVPEWRAVNLEKSDYMKLISAGSNELTTELVADAYGYNGLITTFAHPFKKVNIRPDDEVPIPTVLRQPDILTRQGLRSFWVYNKAGLMVDYRETKTNVSTTKLKHVTDEGDVGYIESFNMGIKYDSPLVYGNTNIESWDLEQYGFRCFVCQDTMQGPSGVWDDVTESKLYTYTPGRGQTKPKITWNWGLLTQGNLVPIVYIPKYMYVYRATINKANGDYDGVIEVVPRFILKWNNREIHRAMDIPVGNIDVFVNGLSLIEGIDYVYKHDTIIINTHGLHTANKLDIVVRYYGFSNPETDSNWKPREIGFVKGGKISVDGKYGIHKDKATKVILGGLVKQIDEINTGEEDGNGKVPFDGTPYSIVDYNLPIENIVTNRRSYPLFKEVYDIDKRVSDYLSTRIPQKEPVFPHVHIQRYKLVSPVISAIINAMLVGMEFDELIINNYNTDTIDKFMQPYKWLLEYDPAALDYDNEYVMVEPHGYTTNVSISQKQYTFLEWIIKIYLRGRVDLSHNVVIG